MINGPALWKRVLEPFGDQAIVAGGAIRDWVFGGTPKDIDVFVPFTENFKDAPYGVPPETPPTNRHEEYFTAGQIELIDNFKVFDQDVQIIYLREGVNPIQYMQTFDLGLSKCLYDGNIFLHEDFVTDHMNNTITVLRPGEQTTRRATALQQKYAHLNWSIIDNSHPMPEVRIV